MTNSFLVEGVSEYLIFWCDYQTVREIQDQPKVKLHFTFLAEMKTPKMSLLGHAENKFWPKTYVS